MAELFLADVSATLAAGAALAPLLRAGDVVTLSGPLGAGKTSFARGVLGALGLEDEAPSPSFAIVIAYEPPDVTLPLWHVDLYRLADPQEALELGLEDALHTSALLIEWPEHGAGRWADALALRFAASGDGRRLTWEAGAAWADRWPPAPLR
ncbi:tRNA threonylcarbamoyladenosine biosynthesis protein TsaE [Sphingomonas vulcanisoli]|uniref:tRNA threonylcarbamoyladenosine biosynthesis protein TsaE n=1 Tax=Sphingomonas vulcanisoli TaxID=1658060 RepID=A0ABX0TPB5_9SPHN|nr:tRNA (adenosine(37)-N6)-threonylcarbamoyltransferase complex ATPase subunit type 1 TsaE [Sphingomonas vulcanisoli]NIJ06599.1 tRNA threonylcarbamoyladenosine biosynthesis protein TsaE [Sphingomonas vulcanisoli]